MELHTRDQENGRHDDELCKQQPLLVGDDIIRYDIHSLGEVVKFLGFSFELTVDLFKHTNFQAGL